MIRQSLFFHKMPLFALSCLYYHRCCLLAESLLIVSYKFAGEAINGGRLMPANR